MKFRITPITILFAVCLGAEGRLRGRRIRNGEPCDTPGYFGDAEDCRKFYRCAEHPTEDPNNPHLIKYSFRCPSGTVFDEALSTCNHPEAVPDKPANCQVYDPEDEQSTDNNGQYVYGSSRRPFVENHSGNGGQFPKQSYVLPTVPAVQTQTNQQLWNPYQFPSVSIPVQYANVIQVG